jgi:hypothetical protein
MIKFSAAGDNADILSEKTAYFRLCAGTGHTYRLVVFTALPDNITDDFLDFRVLWFSDMSHRTGQVTLSN